MRNLPSKCPCGSTFDITHVLNCKRGGYVIMRDNNIRDLEANTLRKLHSDVETEPELQSITTERLRGLSNDQCKPDIRARGVTSCVKHLLVTKASFLRKWTSTFVLGIFSIPGTNRNKDGTHTVHIYKF